MPRKIDFYNEIKEGMTLHCISENYEGSVRKINGVLQTDCMGWGYESISNLDLDDIEVIKDGDT